MDSELRTRIEWTARFRQATRDCFTQAGDAEVQTPVLSPFLIPEPAIEVFGTHLVSDGKAGQDLYLAPSPELWMKRLIARGSGSIFQVAAASGTAISAAPCTTPSSGLLEYYTVGGSYLDRSRPRKGSSTTCWLQFPPSRPAERLAPPVPRHDHGRGFPELRGDRPGRLQEVDGLIGGRQGRGAAPATPGPGSRPSTARSLPPWSRPCPARSRSCCRTSPPRCRPPHGGRPGTPWAERWELYLDGVEVANCYTEETDPAAVARFLAEETPTSAEPG